MVKWKYWGDICDNNDLDKFIREFSNCECIHIFRKEEVPYDAIDEDGDEIVDYYGDRMEDECFMLVNKSKEDYFAVIGENNALILEDLLKRILESKESEETKEIKEEPVKNDRRLNLLF
jgi:hypothetical protein